MSTSVESPIRPEYSEKESIVFEDAAHRPIRPTTTAQQDLTTAGQRRVNLIWEYTQAAISLMVVVANMSIAVFQGLVKEHGEFPAVLQNTLFLVVGFYFSRTNHSAIGGIGSKPAGKYMGR